MRAVFGLVLVIGMGLAGFAIFMVQGYFQEQNAALAAQQAAIAEAVPTIDVYAVNRVMEYGEQITEDDVVVIKYAQPFLPEGVFLAGPALTGEVRYADANGEPIPVHRLFTEGSDELRVVLRQMEPNEPVLLSKVTAPGEDTGINARLAPGMRAFTIEVDVASGVSGFLSPGDRVDVFWTGRVDGFDAGGSGEVTQLIGASIEIIAIDQTSDSSRTGATIARTVTVEVTPSQAGNLTHGQATGNLSLTLVGREDRTVSGAIEVDQASMLGLVAPTIAPEVQQEEICTIRTRRGAEVVEIAIPCTN
ncbi:MAG: Flp pilus assembly protein CpaB [Pseudomonadota bacterium]